MIVSHFLVAVIHVAASHANLDAFFGREGDKLEMRWISGVHRHRLTVWLAAWRHPTWLEHASSVEHFLSTETVLPRWSMTCVFWHTVWPVDVCDGHVALSEANARRQLVFYLTDMERRWRTGCTARYWSRWHKSSTSLKRRKNRMMKGIFLIFSAAGEGCSRNANPLQCLPFLKKWTATKDEEEDVPFASPFGWQAFRRWKATSAAKEKPLASNHLPLMLIRWPIRVECFVSRSSGENTQPQLQLEGWKRLTGFQRMEDQPVKYLLNSTT